MNSALLAYGHPRLVGNWKLDLWPLYTSAGYSRLTVLFLGDKSVLKSCLEGKISVLMPCAGFITSVGVFPLEEHKHHSPVDAREHTHMELEAKAVNTVFLNAILFLFASGFWHHDWTCLFPREAHVSCELHINSLWCSFESMSWRSPHSFMSVLRISWLLAYSDDGRKTTLMWMLSWTMCIIATGVLFLSEQLKCRCRGDGVFFSPSICRENFTKKMNVRLGFLKAAVNGSIGWTPLTYTTELNPFAFHLQHAKWEQRLTLLFWKTQVETQE